MIEFRFNDDLTMLEHKDNELRDENSYLVVSKSENIFDKDILNCIQIVDEQGEEMKCTISKFIEIFDKKGLSGFVI